ncbi:MAG: putative rane protein [Myxococcaceae bacterium]|nr:putative rane protein [Myxococcaceae bacterium]
MSDALTDRRIELEEKFFAKQNQELVEKLKAQKLIQVAWADGAVDAKEQAAVLAAANASGILKGSSAHTLLEGWLKLKPPAALENAWANYVKALVEGMKAEDKALLKNELLGKARSVAEASGGILGMGAKISKAEGDALKKLEAAFN